MLYAFTYSEIKKLLCCNFSDEKKNEQFKITHSNYTVFTMVGRVTKTVNNYDISFLTSNTIGSQ